jgi:RNA polymerase sigma-70 factor (ECF subfamily)
MPTTLPNPVLRFIRKLTASVPTGDTTDGQLLRCFVERRDEAAFSALVRRHGPMVLAVCRRVLCDPHDAEDVFQATFLVLVRRAHSIGRPELLGNWLYGVAYRTALKARAVAGRRRAREGPLVDVPTARSNDEAVWRDLRPVLDDELSRLPQKYRVPVVLCYFEGKTHEEAARCLGCPRETISTRLMRARERLRGRLLRRGVTLSGGLLAAALAQNAAPAADVPAALAEGTIQAAMQFAAGQAAAGAASASAALAEGVLQAMFWNQLTRVATLLLAALVLGAGGTALTYRVTATEPGKAKAEAPANPGAKDAAKAPDDKEKLQGTWVGVEGERNGEKAAAEDARKFKLIVKGDRITINPDGENRVSTFKLDPTQKPKAIDLTPQDGPAKGQTVPGIYSLEGDTLKLCVSNGEVGNRPTDFTTKAGSGLVVLVLHREADDKGKDKPPAKEAAQAPKDEEKLQGTWAAVEAERNGEKAPDEEIKGIKLSFEGKRITLGRGGDNHEGTFKLDPTQKPKTIDVLPEDGPEKDKTIRGIYSLEGDTLKLCIDDIGEQARPTEFTTTAGSHLVVIVLRREADDKGKEKPPAKASDDKQKLQGTWVWVEAVRGGKKAAPAEIKDFKMIFHGDKVTGSGGPGGEKQEATFTLDSTQKPKTIDMAAQDGPDKGKTVRGIYSLEGDTLKLCFKDDDGSDRPTEFASTAGNNLVLLVLRRQADDKGKDKPPAKEPPEAAAERQKLQGTWHALSGETDGQPIPEDKVKAVQVIIKGDEIQFKPNRTENRVTFTLDPTRKPKLLSMTAQDGPDKGKTVPVIYELDGDQLKLCFDTRTGQKEPTELATKAGSGLLLFVLKREAPAKEEDKKTDKAKLQGTWQAVSGEENGRPFQDTFLTKYKATFTGDKVKLSAIDDSGEGTYTLDPTKKPKTIDITIKENEKAIGIYEVEGDTLKLCMTEDKDGNERPTEFAGKDKAILIVFKRQADK